MRSGRIGLLIAIAEVGPNQGIVNLASCDEEFADLSREPLYNNPLREEEDYK